MPLNFETETQHADANGYDALLQAIKEDRATLYSIRLDARKGKAGRYGSTGIKLNIIKASMTNDSNDIDEPPEQIADSIFAAGQAHDEESGTIHHFRATLICEDEKGNLHETNQVLFIVSEGADSIDGSGRGLFRSEAADLITHQNKVIKERDRMIGSLLSGLPPIYESLGNLLGPAADAHVRTKELEYAAYTHEMDFKERQQWIEGMFGFLEKIAEPFGITLGDAVEDFINEKTGKTKTTMKQRWNRLFEGLEKEKLEAIETILGEDIWSIAEAMRSAESDEAFCELAKTFIARGKLIKDFEDRMLQVAAEIGMAKAKQLGELLKKAAGV